MTKAKAKPAPAKRRTTAKKAAPVKKTKSAVSKYGALRALFAKRGTKHSIEEIESATGFDHRNALVAISILKSEARTTDPIKLERNPETGLYVRK